MLATPGRRVLAAARGHTRRAGLLPHVASAALVSFSSFSAVLPPRTLRCCALPDAARARVGEGVADAPAVCARTPADARARAVAHAALQVHSARAGTAPAAFAAHPNVSRLGARPFSTAKPVTPIKPPKVRPQGVQMSLATTLKVACLQLACGADKQKNLDNAASKIAEAARAGAELVVLPECFNSPYGTKYFPEYAESVIDGNSGTCEMLSKAARDGGVFLVGGSFPEREGDKLYNTCYIFNKDGDMLARHRKVHLFDIDIPVRPSACRECCSCVILDPRARCLNACTRRARARS